MAAKTTHINLALTTAKSLTLPLSIAHHGSSFLSFQSLQHSLFIIAAPASCALRWSSLINKSFNMKPFPCLLDPKTEELVTVGYSPQIHPPTHTHTACLNKELNDFFLIVVMIRFIIFNHNSLRRKKREQTFIMRHYLPKTELPLKTPK